MEELKERLLSRIAEHDGGYKTLCWMFLGCWDTDGYGLMQWEGRNIKTHRASWLVHRGPIPEGLFVLHRCDNPWCVNPSHLWLGTQQDNVDDAIDKGRHRAARGKLNGHAKLAPEQVSEIKRLLIEGQLTKAEIARRFDVSHRTVRDINLGRYWAWVDAAPTQDPSP